MENKYYHLYIYIIKILFYLLLIYSNTDRRHFVNLTIGRFSCAMPVIDRHPVYHVPQIYSIYLERQYLLPHGRVRKIL